jgi:hypothetical protein
MKMRPELASGRAHGNKEASVHDTVVYTVRAEWLPGCGERGGETEQESWRGYVVKEVHGESKCEVREEMLNLNLVVINLKCQLNIRCRGELGITLIIISHDCETLRSGYISILC